MNQYDGIAADVRVYKVMYWDGHGWSFTVYVGAPCKEIAITVSNDFMRERGYKQEHDACIQVPFWAKVYGVLHTDEIES